MMKAWLALVLVLCCSAVYADDTSDQITQAVDALRAFLNQPPFNEYVMSVQFTTLEAEKDHHNDIVLSHDETWSSWCLDVTVGINLPDNIRAMLPATFWEFKVFYNPIGTAPYDPSSQGSASVSESESGSVETSDSDWVACTMIAYICPDGTAAGRTPDCGFVCGAQPIGGLSYDQTLEVEQAFIDDFPEAGTVSIETLYGKDVTLTPPEKLTDYCLAVAMPRGTSHSRFPDVYNGVRVFYFTYECSARMCEDGTVVGCDQECPEDDESTGSILVPLSAIFFIVTLSACCCCMRRKACKKNMTTAAQLKQAKPKEVFYPAEQHVLLQHQEEQQVPVMPHMMPFPMMPMPTMLPMMPMSPQMAAQMGLPPMPPVPPSMMMPNGAFPVMMQAPNGMWFPAPTHPEDA